MGSSGRLALDEAQVLTTNFESWAFDPAAGPFNAATSQGSGRIVVVKLPLLAPRLITNLHVRVQTAGATLTAGQNLGGLYLSTGAKVTSSETADQSTAWTGTGDIAMAIAGGALLVDPGVKPWVWMALLTVATTPPLFRRSALLDAPNAGCAAAEKRFGRDASTGNTSLPANLTPATMEHWDGVWGAVS